MAKFLSETGLTTLWGRIDSLFVRKASGTTSSAAEITGVKKFTNGFLVNSGSSWTSSDRAIPFSANGNNQLIQYSDAGLTYNPNTKVLKVNSAAVLTAHQTIKQDGVTGATVNRYGTCSIAAGTAAKTVNITTGTFSLETGAKVTVYFSNKNTADNPTLNVNSTGAKRIYDGNALIGIGTNKGLLSGAVSFVYNSTLNSGVGAWQIVGNYNNSDIRFADFFGESTTAAGTAAKETTNNSRNYNGLDLVDGLSAIIWHQYANSGTNATLNVGGSGAKAAYNASGTRISGSTGTWTAGDIIRWVYDTSLNSGSGGWKISTWLGNGSSHRFRLLTGGITAINSGNYNSSTYADTTPTSGSTKLITSGGVYSALNAIESTVAESEDELDSRVTTLENSTVTGSGLTSDKIILGNGTRSIKTSSKGITTTAPSSTSDDTTIPTSKAVNQAITSYKSMEVIKGTQGVSTYQWTGVSRLTSSSAFVDGYSFIYWLPWVGTSTGATLTLTFADSSTKTVDVYVKGTTRMTTHYGAGSSMILTYYSAANISGSTYEGVWAQPFYYSDSNYNVGEYYARYFIYNTSNPLYRYKIFGLKQGKVVPLSITNQTSGTIVSKTPTSISFEIERGLYYYNSTGSVTATGTALAAQTTYSHWGAMSTPHYTFNTEVPVYSDVYLVGSLSDDGTEFKLDTTSNTSWYVYIYRGGGTPAASNGSFVIGKYYMFVGRSYSTANYMSLEYHNPVYYCRSLSYGGTLIPWSRLEGGTAIGYKSHSEGDSTAHTSYSHSEGENTHAGKDTDPWNGVSYAAVPQHIEGDVDYVGAHSEGSYTWAKADGSHAEGIGTKALGAGSHAEGIGPSASGESSHAEGYCTSATNDDEHAEGRYNYSHTSHSNDSQATIHSVGIGSSSTRKNAIEIMRNGDMYIYGVGGYTGSNISTASTLQTILSSSSDPVAITNSEIDTILAL